MNNYNHTIEEYIKFISEYVPHFNKLENTFKMFTIPTQWIEANSVIELLDAGIDISNRQGGKSALYCMFDDLCAKEIPVLEYKEDMESNRLIDYLKEGIFKASRISEEMLNNIK